ncbi:hypothetical protein ACKLNR_001982 [Fusarium oxysporum f. sp. zingiberi]
MAIVEGYNNARTPYEPLKLGHWAELYVQEWNSQEKDARSREETSECDQEATHSFSGGSCISGSHKLRWADHTHILRISVSCAIVRYCVCNTRPSRPLRIPGSTGARKDFHPRMDVVLLRKWREIFLQNITNCDRRAPTERVDWQPKVEEPLITL